MLLADALRALEQIPRIGFTNGNMHSISTAQADIARTAQEGAPLMNTIAVTNRANEMARLASDRTADPPRFSSAKFNAAPPRTGRRLLVAAFIKKFYL